MSQPNQAHRPGHSNGPSKRARRLQVAVGLICLGLTRTQAAAARLDAPNAAIRGQGSRPNIILVLADDQGYGDFGFLGNQEIHTPHLDRLAERSVWMPNFYVTPICSTTRASLLTGRYNHRTGVLGNGNALFPEELTLAERLQKQGYATGLFGKWHLGRHYPTRALDQGFEEVLSFRGGVMRELEDEPTQVRYTNPMLEHNGSLQRHTGFSTDIFFDAALEWMRAQARAEKPFFAYITPAVPHGPYEDIPADTLALYSTEQVARLGEENVKIYALVSKLDQNIGKLLAALEEAELSKNTLVLYLSDNGPSALNSSRFMAGYRGHKGDILEGGIKTPLLAHWPGTLEPREIQGIGSVTDIVPTLLSILDAQPSGPELDGQSLWKQWGGREKNPGQREFVVQLSQDGDVLSNYAVRSGPWKLALPSGFRGDQTEALGLFNLSKDPGETENLIDKQTKVYWRLQEVYTSWLGDWTKAEGAERYRSIVSRRVKKTRRIENPPTSAWIGNGVEEPILLTKSDGPSLGPADWLLDARAAGAYNMEFRFPMRSEEARAELSLCRTEAGWPKADEQPSVIQQDIPAGSTRCLFEGVHMEPGIWEFRARILVDEEHVPSELGVWQVLVSHVE